VSELALGPLDTQPPVVAPVSAADRPLARLRAEIRELEEELRELERRTAEAQQRLEAEDLDSPFAHRATALGSFLALDIVEQGRIEIRGLLAEAQVAAEARSADALREAGEILSAARAEVAAAMGERAASVEARLAEPSPTPEPGGVTPEPVVFGPSIATTIADDPGPEGPEEEVPAGRDPSSVVGLLEASLLEFDVLPLGAPVGGEASDVVDGPETTTPAAARDVPLLAAGHGEETLAPVEPFAHLPAPPETVVAPEEDHEGFADLAELDSSDPFAGDTPATTSEHIEALADLGSTDPAGAAAFEVAGGSSVGSVAPSPPPAGGSAAGPVPGPGASEVDTDVDTARERTFWEEQEAAKRRRWLRPVEILVPMVLALVLFVVLLLWVG
jgi:hypothetical protein